MFVEPVYFPSFLKISYKADNLAIDNKVLLEKHYHGALNFISIPSANKLNKLCWG